ncbi:MAG TPA: YihY/virulence factor BrkB family protein [Acidobacteriaceae bacterium]|jgi:membrane protein
MAALQLGRLTFRASLEHDVMTVAQGTAYAAMVSLFPGLIVAAAVIALLPDTFPVQMQLAVFFDRILPSNVSPVLQAYFQTSHKNPQTAGALVSAVIVSVTGAAGVMATLMEGFRRAHELPIIPGSFWQRRGRALALVPLSLIPMALASALVVFGHLISTWLANYVSTAVRTPVYLLAFVLRWGIALAGSVGILAVIYHLGTDVSQHLREHLAPWIREPWLALRKEWTWRRSLPGAMFATVLWFISTLLFGWYVTRFANYSRVYGSLGAAIALMFWLYIIALSVLIGSEFNAQIAMERKNAEVNEAALWNPSPPADTPDR